MPHLDPPGSSSAGIPVALGPGGSPLGLQIAGADGRDDAPLAAGAWCEGIAGLKAMRRDFSEIATASFA